MSQPKIDPNDTHEWEHHHDPQYPYYVCTKCGYVDDIKIREASGGRFPIPICSEFKQQQELSKEELLFEKVILMKENQG
jgi:hypothetical protein